MGFAPVSAETGTEVNDRASPVQSRFASEALSGASGGEVRPIGALVRLHHRLKAARSRRWGRIEARWGAQRSVRTACGRPLWA